jgi:predicted phage baseplate assembly protein
VARRTLTVLKSSIPFVARVENRRGLVGGVDGEDIEAAKIRGPIQLRTRDRAVTVEDFEQLTREAAPEVARVRCVAATAGSPSGMVRVKIVPAPSAEHGRLSWDQLEPAEETIENVKRRLDECRLIGTSVEVERADYRGLTVVALLRSRQRVDPDDLKTEALNALYRYFSPTEGGLDGRGWPFGRPVRPGDVIALLEGLPGTEVVEQVRLFDADPETGVRGRETSRLDLEPDWLVFSYSHDVRVEAAS